MLCKECANKCESCGVRLDGKVEVTTIFDPEELLNTVFVGEVPQNTRGFTPHQANINTCTCVYCLNKKNGKQMS